MLQSGPFDTTLSEFLHNASYIPQSPVTAASIDVVDSDSDDLLGLLYLYTADGFRHVYNINVVDGSNTANKTTNKTTDKTTNIIAYYSYDAELSQDVSDVFYECPVDAAAYLSPDNKVTRILLEISGYSLYMEGLYIGEIIPPCDRDRNTSSVQPPVLFKKN